jgi:hypothetical protein
LKTLGAIRDLHPVRQKQSFRETARRADLLIRDKSVVRGEWRISAVQPDFLAIERPTDCTQCQKFLTQKLGSIELRSAKTRFRFGFAASHRPGVSGITSIKIPIGLNPGSDFDRKTCDKLPPTFNVVKSRRRARIGIA